MSTSVSTDNSSSAMRALVDFFSGRIYPILVVALVFLGHATGSEVLTNLTLVLLTSAALLLSHSVLPLVPYIFTVVFQISRLNGPGVPNNSDYYATGWRLPVIIISFSILAIALVAFVIRERLYLRISRRDAAVFIPLIAFLAALLLNGAFSEKWSSLSLGYGALVALLLFLPFAIVYYGLMSIEREKVISYISYAAALTAFLLLSELGLVYAVGGVIADGEIVKENILFGWGVWNSMGVALATVIPLVFLGVIDSPRPYLYFGVAALSFVGIILTMSRGAWLFGSLVFAASLAVAAFKARHKLFYRILLGAGAILAALLALLLSDKLAAIFDDNGRFTLYGIGIENFLSSPVFGTGFFGFELPDDPNYFKGADFIPAFAHQTFVELLSSTGIVGLLAYVTYRASTVYIFVRRFDAGNTLLFTAAGAMLLMSLVDNFLFILWPTLAYSVALGAIAAFDGSHIEITRKDSHD